MTTPLRTARRFAAIPVLALAAMAGGLTLTAPVSAAAPEPAPVPRRWQLDIQPSPLRTMVVEAPGVGPRAYFYMTYKVTNNSSSDLLFAPAMELATDDMDVLRSGRDVPVAVTNTILERLQNPLLEDQIKIVGTLLRGPENAKEGLAVWPVPAMHQAEVNVYCAGFSGETTTVEIPVVPKPIPPGAISTGPVMVSSHTTTPGTRPADASNKTAATDGGKTTTGTAAGVTTEKKVLRKTLMLRYRLPGDLHPGQDEPLVPIESRWIMRQ
jgi:hypothetical protein